MAPSDMSGVLQLSEINFDGYWGKPTSTIDWCEANYEVSYYIAEFWNTVSNIVMIIPPLIGALLAKKDGLELRYIAGYLGILVVGIGSWCFHGTLLYSMQLLDELPMIWCSSFLIYMLVEVDGRPRSQNIPLQVLLFTYCLVVTLLYVVIKKPVFHEVAYGLMVIALVALSFRIVRDIGNREMRHSVHYDATQYMWRPPTAYEYTSAVKWRRTMEASGGLPGRYEHSLPLMLVSSLTYGIGFVIWNIDNVYCSHVRELRHSVGYPVKPVLQGHAWWHLFAGIGTYLFVLFATHARARYLCRHVELKSSLGGVFFYIRVPSKTVS